MSVLPQIELRGGVTSTIQAILLGTATLDTTSPLNAIRIGGADPTNAFKGLVLDSNGRIVLGSGSTIISSNTGTIVLSGLGSTVSVRMPAAGGFGGTVTLAGSGSTVQAIPPAAGGFGGTVTLAGLGSTVSIRQYPSNAGTFVLGGSGSTVNNLVPTSTGTTTSTVIILGTTAATLIDSNGNRNYGAIRTSNSTIYLRIGNNQSAPTANSFNIILYGREVYEINQQNLHRGLIQGISQDANSTVTLFEW